MKNLRIIWAFIGSITLITSCSKTGINKLETQELEKMDVILENRGLWKVALFEIDGGDSTKQHFYSNNSLKDENFVRFFPKGNKDDRDYSLEIGRYRGHYSFDDKDKTKINFHDASIGCPSGTVYKPGEIHNIFIQVQYGETKWNIVTLTRDEFVLRCDYKKNYLIKLKRPSDTK